MREPDECDGLNGQCGLAKGHAEPCRTCFVTPHTAETFREVPPISPLAALKGAAERMEAAARPAPMDEGAATCGWWPQPTPGPCVLPAKHEGPHSSATPSPTVMLAEASALVERARVLALSAFDRMPKTMLSRVNGVVRFGDARQWVESLKREAEAREAKDVR